ncbi:hypothetical protein HY504_02980 [Candidatus Wolfebacteria bacterium]|nr:hypothetical protein [Candidatus Wolfebacteria bacterium]
MWLLGYRGDFLGFNFIEGQEILTQARGALEGVVYTNAQVPSDWFVKKYTKKYGVVLGEGSAHAYDAVGLITRCRARSVGAEQIVKCLNTVKDYNGALGPFSSAGTHEFTLPVSLKAIRNNQFVRFEE